MRRYNPDCDPIAEDWLALDEQEAIMLVAQHHRRQRVPLPNETLHATTHAIVENQLALREPVVVEVFTRLQAEGLDRHDAIHAVGSVLVEQVRLVLQGKAEGKPNDAYLAGLRKLTARAWLAGEVPG
jgi:hypothetical protein